MALTDKLKAIADAIRAKTGKSDKLTLAEMPEEIAGISGGDTSIEDSLVTRTATEYTNSRVTSIGGRAFSECSALASVDFPQATSIGSYAFGGCTALTSVNFPQVINGGTGMFQFCSALTSVKLPCMSGVPMQAFQYCSALVSAEFPAARWINNVAFDECSALKTLILSNSTQCRLNAKLSDTPIASGTGYIYVPDDLVDSYKAATNWSTYAAQIKPLSEYTGG